MKDHLESRHYRQLIRAELTSEESEALLVHLAQCERCLPRFEALWREEQGGSPDLGLLFPDAATARRLETRLFHRIHLATLADNVSWLATYGYLRVGIVLIQPLIAGGRDER